MTDTLDAIREEHVSSLSNYGTHYVCFFDGQDWPCHTAQVLALLDAAQAEVARLNACMDAIAADALVDAERLSRIAGAVHRLHVDPRDRKDDNDWQRGFRASRNETVDAVLALVEGDR